METNLIVVETLLSLLPKEKYDIVELDTIRLGELTAAPINRPYSLATFPFSQDVSYLLESQQEEWEEADVSSSFLRKPSDEYHRGSTQKKPFSCLLNEKTRWEQELQQQYWQRFAEELWTVAEHTSLTNHVESTGWNENLLQWCDVKLLESESQLANSSNGLLERYTPDEETIRQLEIARARYASESGDYYVIGDESSGAPVQAALKQDTAAAWNVFSLTEEDFKLLGIGKDETTFEENQVDKYGDNVRISNNISEEPLDTKGDSEGVQIIEEKRLTYDSLHEQVDRILQSQQNDFQSLILERKRSRFVTEEEWAIVDNESVSEFWKSVPNLALEFPFELDDFQKRAILHLEREENVFVTAHTSAGKTVVAEYAIALAMQHQTKCIYTSPIKTLSNQKYRDFQDKFSDVGIITGDISIHPQGSCLIVTTEILRSMLYKGADVVRDIEFVVFDEVHYINDEERGVVWEEVIIMLPPRIKIIMLSATVPNALDFAKWVGRTRQSKVFVISTQYRPVPLQHSAFWKGDMITLVDAKGRFLEESYRRISQIVKEEKANRLGGSFGADSYCAVDFTEGASEKSNIHQFVEHSIARLKREDRQLPQIERLKEMLKRGIAVHHAGLVRILFATETFAMGVNMPARTVVFSSLRKHDGRSFRFVEPGEYIQMAGRAGRRGLDAVGNVLIYLSEDIPDAATLKYILTGPPIRLSSRFRLTYNMILNLLRVEDLKVEDMIRRSFGEAASNMDLNVMLRLLKSGRRKLEEWDQQLHRELQDPSLGLTFDDFQEYYLLYCEIRKWNEYFVDRLWNIPMIANQFLSPGRVVEILNDSFGTCNALIIKGPEKLSKIQDTRIQLQSDKRIVISVLYLLDPIDNERFQVTNDWIEKGKVGEYDWVLKRIDLFQIIAPTSERLQNTHSAVFLPLRGGVNSSELNRAIDFLRKITVTSRLIPKKHMNVHDFEVENCWEQRETFIAKWRQSNVSKSNLFLSALQLLDKYHRLSEKLSVLQWIMSDESLQLMPDYTLRTQVLRKLEFVNEENIVQLKGRAACEINSCDSLLVVQVVFENVLDRLDAAECASLLSIFVFQGSSQVSEFDLTPTLEEAVERVRKIALAIGNLQAECGLPVSPPEYLRQNLQNALMQVVLWWAQGRSFSDICSITDVPEGSIVRNINRLAELLKELKNVTRVIGNPSLYQKLERANESIRRDICFTASLYVS
ncbi:ATP-dependent RNA helicase SKI2 [Galdieria sulphuraria]|nr:ATP-dependent RNA helicase SKI2 [Galdieria sulphuraria]